MVALAKNAGKSATRSTIGTVAFAKNAGRSAMDIIRGAVVTALYAEKQSFSTKR
jgi:hypothetical protein